LVLSPELFRAGAAAFSSAYAILPPAFRIEAAAMTVANLQARQQIALCAPALGRSAFMIAPHGFAAVAPKQFEGSCRAEQIKTPYITSLIKRPLFRTNIRTILIYESRAIIINHSWIQRMRIFESCAVAN